MVFGSLSAFVAALAAFAVGCSSSPAPRSAASAEDEADVARVLDAWHDAAARSDEDAYFALMTPDAIFLGTDATERWSIADFRAYAHPRFAEKKGWKMRSTSRHVTFARDGSLGWFDETLDAVNLGAARGSGVVVRDAEGRWRIAQYVLSITVPNERFGAVKKMLEAK